MLRKYFLIFCLLLAAVCADVTPVTPGDFYYAQQEYLRQISANYAWALTTGNARTIKIAVLDSGVQSAHPDLAVLPGRNFVDNPTDDNTEPDPATSAIYYHGTAVSGIAAAKHNTIGTAGVAWNVEIIPVRVIADNTVSASSRIADGIRWAVDNGADIINMSLGLPIWDDIASDPAVKEDLISQLKTKIPLLGFMSTINIENMAKAYFESAVDEAELREACKYAYDHKVLLVAAMGNTTVGATLPKIGGGYYDHITLTLPQTITSIPAGFDTVIGVAGVNSGNTIGSGSLVGSGNKTTELAAPYSNMWTASPNSAYAMVGQGTSYATPVVSGVAALVKGAYPYLSVDELREILQKTAVQYGAQADPVTGRDPRYGYGVVNAYEAVRDTTPPTINSISVTINESGFSIYFSVTDNNLAADHKIIGLDWSSLHVSVDNILADAFMVTSDERVTVTIPAIINHVAPASIQIADKHGNVASQNFELFKLPTPGAPVLSWVNEAGRNTSINQIISIAEPALPAGVADWGLALTTTTGTVTLNNLKDSSHILNNAYVTDNIADNQVVSVSIFWVAEYTGITSDMSAVSTLHIDDRTPPVFIDIIPALNSSNVIINQEPGVQVKDTSDLDMDPAVTTITITSAKIGPFSITSIYHNKPEGLIIYKPDRAYAYDDTVFVTVNVADSAGNTASISWSYQTENMPTPGAPVLSWVNEAKRNTSINQIISIAQPTLPGNISGWGMVNGNLPGGIADWGMALTTTTGTVTLNNLKDSLHILNNAYVTDNIADNQVVSVSIFWVAEHTGITSDMSTASLLPLGNRTPPAVSGTRPTHNSTDIDISTTINLPALVNTALTSINATALNLSISTNVSSSIDYDFEFDSDSQSFTVTPHSLYYGDSITVAYTVYDTENNYHTGSFTFSTPAQPPTPEQPALVWTNSPNRNTAGEQTISVKRPELIKGVTAWGIVLTTASGTVTINNIDLAETERLITDLQDNQMVQAATFWLTGLSTVISDLSTPGSLTLNDRTPPRIISNWPEDAQSYIAITANIEITAEDNHSGLDQTTLNVRIISAGGAQEVSDNFTFNSNTFEITPLVFHYGDEVTVEAQIFDQEGNSVVHSFAYRTAPPPAPDIPLEAIWLDQGPNSSVYQKIHVKRPVDVPEHIEWWRVVYGNNYSAPISVSDEAATIDSVADNNPDLGVGIVWYDNATGANSPLSPVITINIEDRSSPQIYYTYPGDGVTLDAAWGKPVITIQVGDGDGSGVSEDSFSAALTLNGSASLNYSYTYAAGQFSLTPHLATLNYGASLSVAIRLYDMSDNWTTYNFSFAVKVDDLAPGVNNNTPTDNLHPGSNLSFSVYDADSGIDWTALQVSVNGLEPDIDYSIATSDYNLTIYPTNNFQYNQSIYVTVNIADKIGNAATYTFTFKTMNDNTAPSVTSLNYAEQILINDSLTFYISDTESGVNWDSLVVSVNDFIQDTNYKLTTENQRLTIEPLPAFRYSTTINVTINIADRVGNTANAAFTYFTGGIPAPYQPTLAWVNSADTNTTHNQILTVSRPAAIDYITHWEITLTHNAGVSISLVGTDIETVTFYGLSDRQTVTVSIRWVDKLDSNYPAYSPYSSPPRTISLDDRTPPSITALEPEPNSVNVSISPNLQILLTDHSNIDIYNLHIYVNDIDVAAQLNSGALQQQDGQLTLNVPLRLDYNAVIRVTVNAQDIYNNTSVYAYQFGSEIDITPPEITVLSPANNSVDLDSPTTFNLRLSDDHSGVSLDTLAILFNNEPLRDTPSYSISGLDIYVELHPTLDFYTTYNVTISVQDIAHNEYFVTHTIKTTTTNFHILPHDRYYRTIQEALTRAEPTLNLRLEIAPGIYPDTQLVITKDIYIAPQHSLDGAAVTLDAAGIFRHFEIDGATVTLDNVAILNGHSSGTGGSILLSNAGLSILNTLISGNYSYLNGGVIYGSGNNAIYLENIRALGNRTAIGMGSFFASAGGNTAIYVKDSLFAENKANSNGLFYNPDRLHAIRTNFINNTSSGDNALFYGGDILLEHNVLHGNISGSRAQNIGSNNKSLKIVNSILWNNDSWMFDNTSDPDKLLLINSNILPGNNMGITIPSSNSISQQPGIATPSVSNNYDVSLTGADPGIDRGTSNITEHFAYVYDQYDMGSQEYRGILISHFIPAQDAAEVNNRPTISFMVRNNADSVDTANIQLVARTPSGSATYSGEQLTFTEIVPNQHYQVEVRVELPYLSTVTLSATATENSGNSQTRSVSFQTGPPELTDFVFAIPTVSLLAQNSYPIQVQAFHALGGPLAGVTINFNLVSQTPTPSVPAYLETPTQTASNAEGYAFVTLNIDANEAFEIVLRAANQDQSVWQEITLNVRTKSHVAQNLRNNSEYLTIQAALDAAADGDTIFIKDAYAAAETEQKLPILNWPNVSNITLQAAYLTLNAQIKIEQDNITANISGLIFHGMNNTPLSGKGTDYSSVLKVSSSNFISNKNSALETQKLAGLFISDCYFADNQGADGAALNVEAKQIHIYNAKFINNNAQYNGGAIYLKNTVENIYISRALFKNNSASIGSALHSAISNLNFLMENSILANNTNTALNLSGFSGATLNFSTIVDNSGTALQLFNSNDNKLQLINSILWGNHNPFNNASYIYGINSLSQTNLTNGVNNFSADPELESNYAPRISSAAVNKASGDYAVNIDYAGNSRPLLGSYDVGALELDSNDMVFILNKGRYPTIQEALDAGELAAGDIIQVYDITHNITEPLHWPNLDNITLQGQSSKASLVGSGAYPLLTSNYSVNLSLDELSISSFNNMLLLNNSATVNITFNHVLLANNRASGDIATVTSEYGAILHSAQPVNLVITNSQLSGNQANKDGGLFYTKAGRSSLTITDTVLKNSVSKGQGGIASNMDIYLQQVTFNEFEALNGGGAFAYSNILGRDVNFVSGGRLDADGGVFYECNVTLNQALFKNNQGDNGGIFFKSNFYINHAIFHNNEDWKETTHIADGSASGLFLNSVFWAATDTGKNYPDNARITADYCVSDWPFSKGTGNIQQYPLEAGFINPDKNDYRVTYNSYLIDAGGLDSEYIYDAPDIGRYEYDGTYLSHYTPPDGTREVEVNQPITFRLRNNLTRLAPEGLSVNINSVPYRMPNDHFAVNYTDENNAVTTDYYVTFTPSPNFNYSSTINIILKADNVYKKYALHTRRPTDIHVASHGRDADPNYDGSLEFPFQTIGKAFDAIGANGKIYLADELFVENINWSGNDNIALIGTGNSSVQGDINIGVVTASIRGISFRGTLDNAGRLFVDTVQITGSTTALRNSNYAHIQNTLIAANGTALDNSGTLEIIYANLVSNNTLLNNSAAATSVSILNSIVYGNGDNSAGRWTDLNNLLDIDPLFTDASWQAIAFYSPAVDAADPDLALVSLDIRGVARPEHHLPDIGAYESDKPNIKIVNIVEPDNMRVTASWAIEIIETPAKLNTVNISLELTPDEGRAISINYTLAATGYTLEALPRPLLDTGSTYNLLIKAVNASGNSAALGITLNTEADLTELFVSKDYSGDEVGFVDYPFNTPQKAVQYMLRKQLPAVTINLANAVYNTGVIINLPDNTGSTLNIVIRGAGATLNANFTDRLLTVGSKYLLTLQDLTLSNGKKTGSSASNFGGALLVRANSKALLNNIIFYNNQAARGGAVQIDAQGLVEINNSAFISNNATERGGGANNQGYLTVNATIFSGNLAGSSSTGGGSGIHNAGQFYGEGLIVSGNQSNRYGGFLYADSSSSKIALHRSLFRNNYAVNGGGVIYNGSGSTLTLNNSILDYNKTSSNGGAIFNGASGSNAWVYQSTFIRNAASGSGGAIYTDTTYSSQYTHIFNSAFIANTAAGNALAHIQDKNNNNPPAQITASYPAAANINSAAGDPATLKNLDNYDYTLVENSPLLDAGSDLSHISAEDYAGNPRNDGAYDIGAYEYRQLVQIPPGYDYAYDGPGELTSASTVKIFRYIDGQYAGSLTIPSSNQIDYKTTSFKNIVITPNQIYLPDTITGSDKNYILELYSPERYPFISVNNSVLSDYSGTLTTPNAYLSGATASIAVTDNGYLMTVQAVNAGLFELTHPEAIIFTPPALIKNHNLTSNFTVNVVDKHGVTLSGVEVSLNTSGPGLVTPGSTTGSAQFAHGPAAALSTVTASYISAFETLTATLSVRTLLDDTPPIITIGTPNIYLDTPITHNLVFTVRDPQSDIVTESLSVRLNDLEISPFITLNDSGQFSYAANYALQTIYNVTINIANLAELSGAVTMTFQTKADLSGPLITASPAPGAGKVSPDTQFIFEITDWEYGVDPDSLEIFINDTDVSPSAQLSATVSGDNELRVVYTPTANEFALGSAVYVTLNIADKGNNISTFNHGYVIVTDYTPPVITILAPGFDTENVPTSGVTFSFRVDDDKSAIDLNSISINIQKNNAPRETVSTQHIVLTPGSNSLSAELFIDTLWYQQSVTLTITAKDIHDNTAVTQTIFSTLRDTLPPQIYFGAPSPNVYDVSLNIVVTADLVDVETGINTANSVLKINDLLIPQEDYLTANDRIHYAMPNLAYDTSYNIYLDIQDLAGNHATLSYVFRTVEDRDPPPNPVLTRLSAVTTTNAAYLPLQISQLELGSILNIYANGAPVAVLNDIAAVAMDRYDLCLRDIPSGSITIEAVASDSKGNHSGTSNALAIMYVDIAAATTIDGKDYFLSGAAGTFDEEVAVKILPMTDYLPNDGLTIYYKVEVEVTPADAAQNGPLSITLPLPGEKPLNGNYEIYYYDYNIHEWSQKGIYNVSVNATAQTISFETTHCSIFAVGALDNATKLEAYEIILAPNPVPLAVEPLHFVYKVPNDCQAEVRIYTLTGRLLTKFSQELRSGLNEFSWDGENNWNERIGNGVYLVYISIDDPQTGQKKIIRSKVAVLN